jgi:putative DNA primase/helicase
MNAVDLAGRLGLTRLARSWRGDCPNCGYARTFSVRSARDGAARLFCANGCAWPELRQAVSHIAGGEWTTPPRPTEGRQQAEREQRQSNALRLWEGSTPVPESIAAAYLKSRGLADSAGCTALRFRVDCPHPEAGKLPAMMALITSADGTPVGVHRTFLSPDGSGKAKVEPAKASIGSVWGGAVRLDPAAREMAIGEGIETAASAGKLTGLPVWAAVSAGNMAKAMMLPPEVQSVLIAVDREPTGEGAARAAAVRLRAEGRTVRFLMPEAFGMDANDTLMALLRAKVPAHG